MKPEWIHSRRPELADRDATSILTGADAATMAFYARHAEALHSVYESVSAEYTAGIDGLLGGAERILDAGCGTGRDCLHLLQAGRDVHGVDASEKLLELARARLIGAGFSHGDRLWLRDVTNLRGLGQGTYDAVLCSAVLMHLPLDRIPFALSEFHRVLCPGGRLVISLPESRPGIDPSTRRDQEGRLFTPICPETFRAFCEKAGFSVMRSYTSEDSLGRAGVAWRIYLCMSVIS